MEFGGSAEDMARIVHAHPTLSEAVKEAAPAVDGRASTWRLKGGSGTPEGLDSGVRFSRLIRCGTPVASARGES